MVLYETSLQSYENLGEEPNFFSHFFFKIVYELLRLPGLARSMQF